MRGWRGWLLLTMLGWGCGGDDGAEVAEPVTDAAPPEGQTGGRGRTGGGERAPEGCEKTCPADADGDGVAHPTATQCVGPRERCIVNKTDCDDADPTKQMLCPADADGDGLGDPEAKACVGSRAECPPPVDCDDGDAALQRRCPVDADGDGYPGEETACVAAEVECPDVSVGRDCDDATYTTHPRAVEVEGDGVDNDCDGFVDERPVTWRTVSVDGDRVVDGALFEVLADRRIEVIVEVGGDFAEAGAVRVTDSPGGRSREVILRGCDARCVDRQNNKLLVDAAAVVSASSRESGVAYAIDGVDGTPYQHRVA